MELMLDLNWPALVADPSFEGPHRSAWAKRLNMGLSMTFSATPPQHRLPMQDAGFGVVQLSSTFRIFDGIEGST